MVISIRYPNHNFSGDGSVGDNIFGCFWDNCSGNKEYILNKHSLIKFPHLVFQIVIAESSNHRFSSDEVTVQLHRRFARQATTKKAVKTTTKKGVKTTTKKGTTKKVTTKKATQKGTTKKATTKSTGTTWPRPMELSANGWDDYSYRLLPIAPPSKNNTDYDIEGTNSYTENPDNIWDYQYVNGGIDNQGADPYLSFTTQRNAVIEKRRDYRYYYDYVPPRQTRYFNAFSFNRRFRNKWYWRG